MPTHLSVFTVSASSVCGHKAVVPPPSLGFLVLRGEKQHGQW